MLIEQIADIALMILPGVLIAWLLVSFMEQAVGGRDE